MKNYKHLIQKLNENSISIDINTVLDEYDRKVAKFETVKNKFKPGCIVTYIGNIYNNLRGKIGVVKDVRLNLTNDDIFVVVKYEDEKYTRFFHDKELKIIDLKKEIKSEFSIRKVIFNKPETIVFWGDGTKTVVKCNKRDIYDYEKGIAMAITKKAFCNTNDYYKKFKNFLPKENEQKKSFTSDEDQFKKVNEKCMEYATLWCKALEDFWCNQ
jgi:hypothetical protein